MEKGINKPKDFPNSPEESKIHSNGLLFKGGKIVLDNNDENKLRLDYLRNSKQFVSSDQANKELPSAVDHIKLKLVEKIVIAATTDINISVISEDRNDKYLNRILQDILSKRKQIAINYVNGENNPEANDVQLETFHMINNEIKVMLGI